jgi:hypothetical protein
MKICSPYLKRAVIALAIAKWRRVQRTETSETVDSSWSVRHTLAGGDAIEHNDQCTISDDTAGAKKHGWIAARNSAGGTDGVANTGRIHPIKPRRRAPFGFLRLVNGSSYMYIHDNR